MKFDEDTVVITVGMLAMLGVVGYIAYLDHDTYPESQADCPPGHVYIDYGETPQAGCWPEGAALQIGVYPEP